MGWGAGMEWDVMHNCTEYDLQCYDFSAHKLFDRGQKRKTSGSVKASRRKKSGT